MATRFIEVLPNRGVDDNAAPIPQMIVPLRGTNHILLIDGEGLDVKAENPNMLDITEVKNFLRKDLPKPRMFQLKGRALPGEGGLLVVARRGTTVTATLRVFVLDNRIVRLAVRPLQTAPGVFHAKVRPDPGAFVYEMNEIWAPQANVLIDLVSDKPALIDDEPDQNARKMGAFEADGLTPDTEQGVFQESIQMLNDGNLRSFAPVFLSYLRKDPVKNADFTLFVVHAIAAYVGTNALTDPSRQFGLVSEDADARVWAHELGHFLRGHGESRVAGELMVSGGEGEKIPVEDAVQVFNGLHT